MTDCHSPVSSPGSGSPALSATGRRDDRAGARVPQAQLVLVVQQIGDALAVGRDPTDDPRIGRVKLDRREVPAGHCNGGRAGGNPNGGATSPVPEGHVRMVAVCG